MPEGQDGNQRNLDRLVKGVLGNLMRLQRAKVQGPLFLQDIPANGRGVQPDDLRSSLLAKMFLLFYETYSIFIQHCLVDKMRKITNME